jgi:ribonuclease HI
MKKKLSIIYSIIMSYTVKFDGGCRPNPGCGAGAFIIYNDKNEEITRGSKYIEKGTNNICEYTGLLMGIEKCISLGIDNIKIEGDSLLVINQITSKWKVNNQVLRELNLKIMDLLKNIKFEAKHVYREFNKEADALSTETIFSRIGFSES